MNFKLKVISNQVRKLVFLPIICALVLASCSSPEHIKESQCVGSLGIIDMHGKWIVPPRYERIVYVSKIDAFWVKETKFPPPPPPPDWLNPVLERIAKNDEWKLIDRNGVELKARLPYLREPIPEYPPSQALGVSFYPDVLKVQGPDGIGYCDSYGPPITECIYHDLIDVGDGLWMAREPYRKPVLAVLCDMVIPPGLGSEGPPWPTFVFLDRRGQTVATLPQSMMRPRAQFAHGLLACDLGLPQCVECAVDRTGKIVIPAGGKVPAECEAWNQFHRTKFSGRMYEVPASCSKPILFEPDSPKGIDPKYGGPEAATDDLAIVCIKPKKDKYLRGLVNSSGNWLVKPIYAQLAYCSKDRLVAAKGD